jgi:hypothetical protein
LNTLSPKAFFTFFFPSFKCLQDAEATGEIAGERNFKLCILFPKRQSTQNFTLLLFQIENREILLTTTHSLSVLWLQCGYGGQQIISRFNLLNSLA